jgi:hypothetical protein
MVTRTLRVTSDARNGSQPHTGLTGALKRTEDMDDAGNGLPVSAGVSLR